MKKVLVFAFFLLSFKSFSQYSVGLSAGVIAPVKSSTPKLSAYASASFALETVVPLYKGLKFRTGISYYTFNFQQIDTLIFEPKDSVSIDTLNTYDHNSSYLSMPIGFRYIYDKKQLKPFIEAGILAMVKIDGNGRKSAAENIISPYLTIGVKQSWDNKVYFCASVHAFSPFTALYEKGGTYYYNGIGGYLTIGYDF